jgi:hypothetical protein
MTGVIGAGDLRDVYPRAISLVRQQKLRSPRSQSGRASVGLVSCGWLKGSFGENQFEQLRQEMLPSPQEAVSSAGNCSNFPGKLVVTASGAQDRGRQSKANKSTISTSDSTGCPLELAGS